MDLQVTPHAPPAVGTSSPIPNEAAVLDKGGEEIGGIIVFLEHGYLSYLEIYDWLETPASARFRPSIASGSPQGARKA